MTPLEKQIIINHSLKDAVYFCKIYLKMKLTPEQENFIRSLQEGTEQTFIRQKINEIIANLNEKDKKGINVGQSNFKPKNGAKIDIPKIIEDNNKPLKNL